MKHFQKILYLATACLIVVVTFAVIGQRTVQAVVATLVRNVDEPGRNVYQSFHTHVGGSSFCNQNGCTMEDAVFFDAVPTGQRLVVTTVSGSFDLPVGDEFLGLGLQVFTAGTGTLIDLQPVIISSDSLNVHYSFSQDIHAYNDELQPSFALRLQSPAADLPTNFQGALIGYTVSLP